MGHWLPQQQFSFVIYVVRPNNNYISNNANRHSSHHSWTRIFAQQDHERSAFGQKVWLYQSLGQTAWASAWLGENTQRARSSRSHQFGMACAQRDSDLPRSDQARPQTEFNHR